MSAWMGRCRSVGNYSMHVYHIDSHARTCLRTWPHACTHTHDLISRPPRRFYFRICSLIITFLRLLAHAEHLKQFSCIYFIILACSSWL